MHARDTRILLLCAGAMLLVLPFRIRLAGDQLCLLSPSGEPKIVQKISPNSLPSLDQSALLFDILVPEEASAQQLFEDFSS